MGYIKLDQKITEWQWFNDPEMLALWVHLLLAASGEDKEWQGEPIPRGTLVTSVAKLSIKTGISASKVQNGLRRLKKSGEITTEGTNRWTKITIVNYDLYQGEESEQQATPLPKMPAVAQPKVDKGAVERIYALYPTKCPVSGRALGKCSKDKDKIARILVKMTEEKLSATIKRYIEDSIKDNSYFKNFSTLLNNLPDYEEGAKAETKTDTSLFNNYR